LSYRPITYSFENGSSIQKTRPAHGLAELACSGAPATEKKIYDLNSVAKGPLKITKQTFCNII